MNAKDFQKQAMKAITELSTKAASTIDEAGKLDKAKAASDANLRDAIIGKALHDKDMADFKAKRAALMDGMDEFIAQKVDELKTVAAAAFTPNASGISDADARMLDHVELTDGEIREMVCSYKAVSYTMARALYAKAQARGMDLHDDTPAYVAQVIDAVEDFGGYCKNAVQDDVYNKNFGAFVEKFASLINGASDAYFKRDGITEVEALAAEKAGRKYGIQSARVIDLLSDSKAV